MPTLSEELDLHAHFPLPDFSEWQTQVEKELKGLPLEKLNKQTYETISVKPLYTAADLPSGLDRYPGQCTHLRGESAAGYLAVPWQICQDIPSPNPASWNEAALHDLDKGLDALWLERGQTSTLALHSVEDLGVAFAGLGQTPVYLRTSSPSLPLGALLLGHWQKTGQDLSVLRGGVLADPLADLAAQGHLPATLAQILDQQAALSRELAQAAPGYFSLALDGRVWHRAGASGIQELACLLASAVSYLREFDERGVAPEALIPRLHWTLAIGPDFLLELAKIRALRLLWQRVLGAYGLKGSLWLHATSSPNYLSQVQPYTNLLRVTSQAFCAVLGGVSSLQTACFNQPFAADGYPDEFARRQARNVQLILREESNLARLIDPLGGAYAIETLTQQVAEQAWALFQKIEQAGGMMAALESGLLQSLIATTRLQRQKDLATRKQGLVGTSVYALSADESESQHLLPPAPELTPGPLRPGMPVWLPKPEALQAPDLRQQLTTSALHGAQWRELQAAFCPSPDQGAQVSALGLFRASEPFEALRNRVASLSQPPTILLLPLGERKMYQPRVDFCLGFLQVAGLTVEVPAAFASVEAAAEAWSQSGAAAAVLCSADALYPELVTGLLAAAQAKGLAQGDKQPLLLAGYPKEQVDHYKALGIAQFLYLGADLVATLNTLLDQLSAREGN
ncbi:MAG: methylmalonyl-CoA mutase family protein [Candidatus Sericytochromatia bacterium]